MNFSLSGNLFKGIGIATIGALVLSPDTLFMRWSEMNAWSMLTWRGFEMGLMLILFSSCFGIYRKNFKKVFSRVGIWIILSQILSSIFFTYGVAVTSVSLILFCLATSPIFASFALLYTCEIIEISLIFNNGFPGSLVADNLEGIIIRAVSYTHLTLPTNC